MVFIPSEPSLNLKTESQESFQKDFEGIREPTVAGIDLARGWGRVEDWGVWGMDDASRINVMLPDSRKRRLFLECNAYPGLIKMGRKQEVLIRINSREIGRIQPGKRMKPYNLPVPKNILKAGRNFIDFSYSSHASPLEVGEGQDFRQLAIGLRKIALETVNTDWSPSVFFDKEDNSLHLDRSGRLVILLPDDVRRITFISRMKGGVAGAHCRMMIKALPTGHHQLETISQQDLPSDGKEGVISFKIDDASSVSLRGLVFDLNLASTGGSLEIQSLKWSTSPFKKGCKTPHAGPDQSDLPDIVLIILDAARADHFGFPYGYSRNTTPNISRLAESSLVFHQVTALAPYTMCSVPTMLTGLSFRSHGIVDRGNRLSQQVVTMAERLHDAGYKTLAFSGTPNDSIRLGFNQGYDEFFEAWRSVPEKTGIDPYRLVGAVRKQLNENSDERPLHMLVHFVPPHAPYEPRKEFKIFDSPEYRGKADGSNAFLEQVISHRLKLDHSDIEYVQALYDGNLLMADDAVSELLEIIRRKTHWPNTVIAITADHGEAFLEHGDQGHNTTIYEEMMRVPLILHLPPGFEIPRPDLKTKASLEDLAPTLLSLAGLKPDLRSRGRNVLDSDLRERWLFLRSATTRLRGLCGFGWKFIMTTNGRKVELYNLETDPHEHHNLSLEQPELAAMLGMRLIEESRAFELVAPDSTESPLSIEDTRALRELGYIQ